MRRAIAWVVLLLMSPGPAFGQERVALVALDDSQGSTAAASRMAELLASNGRHVVFGQRVWDAVEEHRVVPDSVTARDFLGISERIASGANDFFYKGEKQALAVLQPILEMGARHPEFLASRPDLVPQFYEAGLLVLRAYQGLKQPENAEATALLLARTFPALSPSLKTAPPDVLELVRRAKARVLEADGAAVGIRLEANGACRRYLNGSPIEDGLYPVAADTPVFLSVSCDGANSDVWRLQVPSGARVLAPVSVSRVAALRMDDDSFEARRRAEVALEAIAFWGGFAEVVGIRQPASRQEAPTLFGLLRARQVTWTETRDVPAFEGFVERTFDVRMEHPEAQTAFAPNGWMLGAGGALVVLGGASWWFASHEVDALVCSGSATQKPTTSCEAVGPGLSQDAFDARLARANTLRISGVTAIVAGVALLTWAVWSGWEEPPKEPLTWQF